MNEWMDGSIDELLMVNDEKLSHCITSNEQITSSENIATTPFCTSQHLGL